MSTLLRGSVIAAVAALVIAVPSVLGLSSPWPVLLVAAVAFARPTRPGAAGALLLGGLAWWGAMALRAGVLPDATSSEIIAALAAIAICTGAAALSGERLPLWAGLGGAAAFAALYEPTFAESPTAFLTDSPLAFGALVVATGLGFLAAVVVDLVTGAASRDAVPSMQSEVA